MWTLQYTHSVRVATASAAKSLNVPIENILSAAGWAEAETFRKYYTKLLLRSESFGNVLFAKS